MPPIDPPPPDRSPAVPVRRRNRFERIADRFHFSWRDTLVTLVPVVLLLALVGYVAQRFVRPAPP